MLRALATGEPRHVRCQGGVTSRLGEYDSARSEVMDKESAMPKCVIEREISGAGKLSSQELKGISQKSCSVLSKMGPQIQWLESYVTGDKIF